MLLYINTKNVQATGEFFPAKKTFVVKKGSKISESISHSEKFRGARSIEKNRLQYVANRIVVADVVFKSPSTAANFVTGCSTNGLTTWKDENGVSLKEILGKEGLSTH